MKAKVIKTEEIVDVYHESQHGQVTNIYKESVFVNGRMWSEDELDFYVKANEFPNKIYLQEPTKWVRTEKSYANDVEYVRTDAFIEKACDAYCKVCGHYQHTVPTHICRQGCDYYTDFRNRIMKG